MSDGEEESRDAAPRGATLDDWKLLDVMPGVPERALRTAYARKLKTTKPETDPDGFQRLRAAYERARTSLAEDKPAAEATAAPEAAGDDTRALADLMHRFESRRRRGNVEGALAVVDEALSGPFRAAWRNGVEDALFDSIADDPSARLRLVGTLAARFDWGEATGRQVKRSEGRITAVRERAEAAALVTAFRARAAAARAGTGPEGDKILARILGPYRVGLYDRALVDAERAVAVEFMSVAHRLSGVDGFVDPRMLAALRSALGAAPLGDPPPARQSAPAPKSPAVSAPPRRRRSFSWRYLYFAALALLLVGRTFQSEFGKPDPDAATYSSSVGRPDIPDSLEVSWQGDQGLLNLQPLLQEQSIDTVSAVRIRYGDESKDVPLSALRENSVVAIPRRVNELFLRLVFTDGTLGPNKDFDIAEPKPGQPPAPSPPKTNELAAHPGDATAAPIPNVVDTDPLR